MSSGNDLPALAKMLVKRAYRGLKRQFHILDARLSSGGAFVVEDTGGFPPRHWEAEPLSWGTEETWGKYKDCHIPEEGRKVVLGSGHKRIDGWLNVDVSPEFGPDLLCDVSKGLPFRDSSVSAIVAIHVLEHLPDTVTVMNEMWRACCHGALVHIRVPHQDSLMAFADPTHKRWFNEETFGYFCMNGAHYRYHESYGIQCRFELLMQRVHRHRRFGELEVLLRAHKTVQDLPRVATLRRLQTVAGSKGYRSIDPLFDQSEIKPLPWEEGE